MTRYMLDTNTANHMIKAHPRVAERIVTIPTTSLCISAITQGELLFGLAKRPEARRLRIAVQEFLLRVDIAPWDSVTAEGYGTMRAAMESQGRILSPLDMLIAAHALSLGAVLISSDKAFVRVGLSVEDWLAP